MAISSLIVAEAPGTAVHAGKTFYLSARLVFDTFAAAARVKSSEFLGSCLVRMGGTHLARAIGDAANAEENIPVMEILMWSVYHGVPWFYITCMKHF